MIPISGDPWNPRPSGILSYTIALGRYLGGKGIGVEFLSVGERRTEGAMVSSPIAPTGAREAAFARRLARIARGRRWDAEVLVIANSEIYAWAFRKARPRPPIVLVMHGPTYPTLLTRRPFQALVFRWTIEPGAVRVASKIIAIDTESEHWLRRRYPDRQVARIPVPVDIEHFRPIDRLESRAKWGINGRLALLYVGRLAPEKNPLLAIEVFRQVHKVQPKSLLLVAGKGPLMKDLIREQRDLGGQALRLLGPIDRSGLPSLYSAADALMLSSDIEQFPTVVVESLACGTPVFSTDVGDVRRVLHDAKLGQVCPKSARTIAETILRRLPENEDERAKYGTTRRNEASRYSWERLGPSIIEVLHASVPPK